MKSYILIIILILSISSSYEFKSSIIPKIQCLIRNEVIYEKIITNIKTIETKNISNIIHIIIKEYPILKNEFDKCWNEKNVVLLFPMKFLKQTLKLKCIGKCYGECSHIKKHFEYVMCAEECIKKNCQNIKEKSN